MTTAVASAPAVIRDLDGFLSDLGAAQARAFGVSHIGARERLYVAHLSQTLVGSDEHPGLSPEAFRGALRAALAKTQAEAALFDRVYALATRPRREATGESGPDEEVEEKSEEDQGHAPPEPGTLFTWLRRRWLLIDALAAVAVVIVIALIAWPTPKTVTPNGAGPKPIEQPVDPPPAKPDESGGGPTISDPGAGSATQSAADLLNQRIRDEVDAILDRAAPFGYRLSPRELASVMTGPISGDRSELDLARMFAKAADVGPDEVLDLFDEDKAEAIYTSLYAPLNNSITFDVLADAIMKRAMERLEYITFTNGRPSLRWREDGDWREQAFVGEGLDQSTLLAKSADGSRILTSGANGGILWDGETFTQVAQLEFGLSPREAWFSDDGERLLVLGSDGLSLWDAGGKALTEFRYSTTAADLSRDGRFLLVAGSEGGWNVYSADAKNAGEDISLTAGEEVYTSARFSDDGDKIVTTSRRGVAFWSTATGQALPITLDARGAGDARFYDHDTRLMVTRLSDGLLFETAGKTMEPFGRWENSGDTSSTADLSEDGRALFVGSAARGLHSVYDPLTGSMVSNQGFSSTSRAAPTLPGHSGFIESRPDSTNAQMSLMRLVWRSQTGAIVRSQEFTIDSKSQISFNVPSLRAAAARAAEFGKSRAAPERPMWPLWLAIGLPLLIAAIALAHPAAWRRAYLRRRQIENETLLRRLSARLSAADPLKDERRAVARLDQRLRVPSHRLDVKATVQATARSGGMFTPIADTDAGTPEYVALIEQRRTTDADAQRMIAFFNRLKSAGLSLVLYTYSGSPEALTPVRGGRSISIETLRQRHAGAFLFITGDAGRFYNRRTGTAAPWTRRIGPVLHGSQLSFAPTWAGGAFLSREPLSQIGPAERAIERDVGLVVRGASAADLRDIGDYFHGKLATLAAGARAPVAIVPPYFAVEPERLMQEAPPNEIERAILCDELEAWLGKDGRRWVCSLAYYPMVQWDLARYLESVLIEGQSAEGRERLEARVARLPWLEHGYMPEWVRETLIAAADRADERKAIRSIVELMARAEEGGDGDVAFSLAGPDGLAGEGNVDAIFIEAVARAKARPWDLPPPAEWLKRMPALARMPWARMRIALAGLALAMIAALIAPHAGSGAMVSEWLPLLVLALTAAATLLAPTAVLRFAERRK